MFLGFFILVRFLFQTNYVAYHYSLFYQILDRSNDPKKMELASLQILQCLKAEARIAQQSCFELYISL